MSVTQALLSIIIAGQLWKVRRQVAANDEAVRIADEDFEAWIGDENKEFERALFEIGTARLTAEPGMATAARRRQELLLRQKQEQRLRDRTRQAERDRRSLEINEGLEHKIWRTMARKPM